MSRRRAADSMYWQVTRGAVPLTRPLVMGIVNITPDSFSDGGFHADVPAAITHCERLLRDGADMLDLGGESSRPGAAPVDADVELARVMPVLLEAVRLGIPISVDTCKPQVMQAALDAGADIINDIWALRWRDPAAPSLDALDVVARHGRCGICLMHMHGQPLDMQRQPMEGDAVPQVLSFLQQRTQTAIALGVDSPRIVVDPGIGFGKSPAQNLALLGRQSELRALGYPLLVGWSRKSTLATVCQLQEPADSVHGQQQRLVPSVLAAVLAVQGGAAVVRVHDVAATVQGLRLLQVVQDAAR